MGDGSRLAIFALRARPNQIPARLSHRQSQQESPAPRLQTRQSAGTREDQALARCYRQELPHIPLRGHKSAPEQGASSALRPRA